MHRKLVLTLTTIALTTPVFAAHIVTETRQGDTPIKRTDTYANSSGDMRVEERGFGSSASSAAVGSANSSDVSVNYHLGDVEDVMLFQSKGKAIVVLEGSTCRRMTADSPPPSPFNAPGINLGDVNKQMADAMQKANSAMAEAMAKARKEGMTAEQQRQIEQFTKGLTQPQSIKPRDTLEIYALNEQTRVGEYLATGYGARDQNGVDKHRMWMVSVNQVPGGKNVRKAMKGMFETYSEFLDKMGGGALMDTGLAAMFEKAELAKLYPVRIEDLESGEVTDVVEANAGGSADYYPECEVKDMFGM